MFLNVLCQKYPFLMFTCIVEPLYFVSTAPRLKTQITILWNNNSIYSNQKIFLKLTEKQSGLLNSNIINKVRVITF